MKIIDISGAGQTVECNPNPLGDNRVEPTVQPAPGYIAFTCSADPKRKFCHYEFHELSPNDQKKIYFLTLKQMFNKYKHKYGFKTMLIHYELDKSSKIHCHGYVDCKDTIVGYDIPKLEIMSYIHKLIGRKGNKKNVSITIKWIDGIKNKLEEWIEYCNKENILKKSKIINSSILDYLE